MRLLITGGAGFIGSNFIRYWLKKYPEDFVFNLDALTYAGNTANLLDVEAEYPHHYQFARGDIAESDAVERVLRDFHPDIIVNFAAESHNSLAVLNPSQFFKTNVMGTQTLLEAARKQNIERFHHISTCEVYGDLSLDSEERFTETSPLRPRTPYNASKAGADLAVRAYFETWHLPVTISNCCNNYGPFQFPEKLIPLFLSNLLDDQPVTLYQASQNRREWLHVDDHCRAVELILRKGKIGETYNVGSGIEKSVEEIADILFNALNKPLTLKTYVADRPGHDRRYLLDSSKIQNELDWQTQISFEQGMRETIQWYIKHRSWWEPLKQKITLQESAWSKK